MWSIQVYDTRPQSDNKAHLKALAETLHKLYSKSETHRERIDVFGMPLPVDMSDEERAARCKIHMQAEILPRETGPTDAACDFHIPQIQGYHWLRGLLIIDRPQEQGDMGEDGFLVGYWGACPEWREHKYVADNDESETWVFRATATLLEDSILDLRSGKESFYVNFSDRFQEQPALIMDRLRSRS